MPKSAWGCALAQRTTSGNQGHGTITLAEVIQPFSKACKVARFTEWAMPKSSAWMMSSLVEAGYPSFSCRVGEAGEVCAAARNERMAGNKTAMAILFGCDMRRAYGTPSVASGYPALKRWARLRRPLRGLRLYFPHQIFQDISRCRGVATLLRTPKNPALTCWAIS